MEIFKKCKVKNCENKVWEKSKKKGYCCKHYLQTYKYKKILERTRFDPNEIIDCGNYCKICIYSGLGEQKEIALALIDKEDLEKVKGYKWGLNGNGKKRYIYTRINKKIQLSLHQLIMGKPPVGYEIDHRDTNPLNNRKYNLRFVTHQQNVMNKKIKGYYWYKAYNKWSTKICINGKEIHLGYFTDEQDAIKARREAEQKYFGEFAYKELIK